MTDVLRRASGLPDAVVRYADHPDGLVDLHLPGTSSRGLVVLLHGGFWRADWDRRHTRPMAEALRAEGHLVATPEYRRTGATGAAAGGWPHTLEDVRTAVDRLPALLAGLGVEMPPSVTLLGHSAGGHLALWLASESLQLPLARVVALAPVGDLADAEARNLGGGAVRDLIGGASGEHPERYAAADPARRLSVPSHGRATILVLHGVDDSLVPVGNSGWAHRAPGVDLRRLVGVGHFEVIDPEHPAWSAVLAAVDGPVR